MNEIRIGLVGSGFIGKTIALAIHSVNKVFEDAPKAVPLMLSDIDPTAQKKAFQLGFERYTEDYQQVVKNPDIDLVMIATPNYLHKPMVLDAIENQKAVFCEKPIALSASEADIMYKNASQAQVIHMVGYQYLQNPIVMLMKQILNSGEIGEPISFKGTHNEDYLASPETPFSWRCEKQYSGSGALGDLGSHALSMALYLMGSISQVSSIAQTVIPKRKLMGGHQEKRVENEDQLISCLKFSSGALGSLETSRVAMGRKLGLTIEINCTKGSLYFNQERMNELQLYKDNDPCSEKGFKTILLGPEHPYYSSFCPAPGHGLGYNDLKVIELYALLKNIQKKEPCSPDFRFALEVEHVIDSMLLSHQEQQWVAVPELGNFAKT